MATEQYGFYVDTSRCIKCWSCVVSCKQWHEIKAGGISRRKVKEEDIGKFPDVKRKFTSLSCMHCASPACVAACPQGAISKREEDGIVVVDESKCIKCGTCAKACPFEVPEYDDKVMNKCDACLGLGRAADEEPHCVKSCVTQALHFGKLTDMAALAEKKGGKQMEGPTKPSVYLS